MGALGKALSTFDWIRRSRLALVCCFFMLFSSIVQASCPDTTLMAQPKDQSGWDKLHLQLEGYLSSCLRNPDYFALYGAAQLHVGLIGHALESLERALLLNPEHGSAMVDYAEALYHNGEVLAALALNQQLQQRDDLPEFLRLILENRNRLWRSKTKRQRNQLSLLTGYDSNLNGAPNLDSVTLTAPVSSVEFNLGESSKAVDGAHLKLYLSTLNQTQFIDHDQQWVVALNSRISDDSDSNVLRIDGEYQESYQQVSGTWDWSAGLSYLNYGGSALYTALDVKSHFSWWGSGACRPEVGGALQWQHFPGQPLDGLELRLGGGGKCRYGRQHLSVNFDVISNRAESSARPGGDRLGWEFQVRWGIPLYGGVLTALFQYTQLQDDQGYSPLLSNGASRHISRAALLAQYIYPIAVDMNIHISAYHSRQYSNLELFKNDVTTLDIGFNLFF